MFMGYARVSRADQQDTKAQVDALLAAGADRIFEDQASGGRWPGPQVPTLPSTGRAAVSRTWAPRGLCVPEDRCHI